MWPISSSPAPLLLLHQIKILHQMRTINYNRGPKIDIYGWNPKLTTLNYQDDLIIKQDIQINVKSKQINSYITILKKERE